LPPESPGLVIPCRDDDVRYLASLAGRVPEFAPRLLCGTAGSAEIVTDKVQSHEFCVAHGLPFVPSHWRDAPASRAAFVREQGFPLVAKPRRGFASRDVRLLWNEAQLDRALARGDYVVQRFLGDRRRLDDYFASIEAYGVPLLHSFMGEKHSIEALIGPRGDVRDVMATRNRKDLRSRSVVPDTTPATLALGRRCAEALARSGWRGPLNIQCQEDGEGALWIHEFNGRFTGITADRALLGHNEVAAAIFAFTGFAFDDAHPPAAASVSLASLVSRAADPRLVRSLASEGIWRRTT
jgi:biotin carboxylase